jgi:hypothetical protein
VKKFLIITLCFLCISCTVIKLYTCEHTDSETKHTYVITPTRDTVPDSIMVIINDQRLIITNSNKKYTVTGLRIN